MSRTIDEKVVEMKFDNKDFEKNVKTSLSTLEKLKESLNLDQAVSKMESAKNAISKIKLFGGVKDQVEDVKIQFDGMRVFSEQIIRNIADAFYGLGAKIVKGAFGPLTQGGMDRALGIEQAKFQLEGLGVAWEKIEKDINYGVQDTAYGLDSAAKAAAQLTASGVQMGEEMQHALRGISGVAAMTNSEYEDISRIFTTVAGNGRLMGDQLNQLGARGLNAAATLAKALNTSEAEVREMVSRGKIDFQTFADAMDNAFGDHAKDANKTFTGALSNMKFALKKIGAEVATIYTQNMTDVFNAIRPMINEIKNGLMPIIGSSVLSNGAYSLLYVLGQLAKTKAVSFFNGLTESVKIFNERGGFRNIADALANVLMAIRNLIAPIKKAFVEVFGDANNAAHPFLDTLVKFTQVLVVLTQKLLVADGVGEAVYTTFKGVFSIFKMVGTIIGKVLGIIAPVMVVIFNVVVKLSAVITRLVSSFVDWAKAAKPLSKALTVIKNVLVVLIGSVIYGVSAFLEWVSSLEITRAALGYASLAIERIGIAISGVVGWIGDIVAAAKKLDIKSFGSYLQNKLSTAVSSIYNKIKSDHPIIYGMLTAVKVVIGGIAAAVAGLFSLIKTGFSALASSIKSGDFTNFLISIKDKMIEFGTAIGGMFGKMDPMDLARKIKSLGLAIKDFLTSLDPGTVIAFAFSAAVINLMLNISKFMQIAGGLVTTINKFIGQFVNPVSKKLDILKSKILQLSIFVLSVAAALKIISTIDVETQLWPAVNALMSFVLVLSALSVALTIIDKKVKTVKGAGISSITTTLLSMSVAILAIAAALKIMESITADWKDILVKLGGIAAVVSVMTTLSILVSKFAGDKKVLSAVFSIVALSVGVLAIATAMEKMANLPMTGIKDNIVLLVLMMGMLSTLSLAMSKIKLTGVIGIIILCKNIDLVLDALDKTFNNESFKSIISGVKEAFKTFNDFVNNHMEEFAASLGAATVLASLITANVWLLSESLENMSKAFNNVMTGIAKIGLVILSVGATLLMISGTVAIFEKLAQDTKFDTAVKWVAGFAIGLGVFISALALILKQSDELIEVSEGKGKNKDIAKAQKNTAEAIKGMAKFMLSFGVSMLLLGASMKLISSIPTEDIGKAIGAVSLVMLMVISMVGIMSFAPAGEKLKTGPIIAAMAGIAIIIAEMVVLTTVAKDNMEELKVASNAIFAAMLAFGAILAALAFIQNKSSNAKAGPIIALLGGLASIVAAIGAAGYFMLKYAKNFESMKLAAITIVGGIGAIGVVLYAITKSKMMDGRSFNLKKAGSIAFVMAALAGTIVSMGFAISLIVRHSNDWASIAAAGGSIAGGLLAMTAIMYILSKVKLTDVGSVVLSMVGVAAAIFTLGAALALASQQPWRQILSAGGMIVAVLGVMALAIGVLGSLNTVGVIAAAGALVITSAGLVLLAVALKELEGVSWGTIGQAAVIIVLIAVAIGALSAILTPFFLGGIILIGILLALSVAMLSFAAAAIGFGIAANLVAIACNILAASISVAAAGLEALFPQLLNFVGLDIVPIANGLKELAIAIGLLGGAGILLGLGAVGIGLAAVGIAALGLAIQFFSGIDLTALSDGLVLLKESMAGLVSVGYEGLTAAVGIGAMAIALGVLDLAILASVVVFDTAMLSIQAAFVLAIATLSVKAFKAGLDATLGLSSGMAAGSTIVYSAAANMAKLVLQAIRDITGWASPWTTTTECGKDGVRGLTNGFSDSGALSGLGASIKNLCSKIELPFNITCDGMVSKALQTVGAITGAFNSLDVAFGFGSEGTATRAGRGGMPSAVANAVDKMNGARSGISGFSDLLEKAGIKSDILTNALGGLTDGVGDYSSALGGGGGGGGGGGAYGATTDLTEGMGDLGSAAESTTHSIEGTKNAIEELADKIRSQMNIFEEFSKGQEISAEEMLNNMRSQVEGVAEWAANLQLLAQRGISDGLLRELTDLGPQGYDKVAAFVKMTDEQLQEASELYGVSLAIPETTASWLVEQFGIVGRDASLGYVNGIDPRCAEERSKLMGLNTLNAIKTALESHSPSMAMFRVGMDVCLGLNNGIGAFTALPVESGASMARSLYQRVRAELAPSKFYDIGIHICRGLVQGIESGSASVINAAVNVAVSAYQAALQALGIASPSKKFYEIGYYSDAGFAKGLEDNQDMVTDAAENMANDALNSLRSTMGMIEDAMNGRYDFDPVIRPTLDLSDLDSGFREIDGMWQGRKLAASIQAERQSQNQNQQPQSITFTQNNYSPKALNRTEIYRQTRNQLSQYREAVTNA